MNRNQHIILIGFKHVGKSVIGKALAHEFHKPFLDLDQKIESLYETRHPMKNTCREMMQIHGAAFFRTLEQEAFLQVIQSQPAVISLGGGTLLNPDHLPLLQPHFVIHIQAPRGIVFERIMTNGRPAFFPPNENPFEAFLKIWDQREPIYQQYRNCVIENNASIEAAVQQIVQHIGGAE